MIEPRKHPKVQADGIDTPEGNTSERGWLVFASCPDATKPWPLFWVCIRQIYAQHLNHDRYGEGRIALALKQFGIQGIPYSK